MPTDSELRSRRDSWPPTQLRLVQPTSTKGEPRPLLEDIDDDPLTYFLTPTPGLEDNDVEDVLIDFDAGIEGPGQPKRIVRSVSPSSLEGLAKPPSRSTSPDFDFDIPTPDEDDGEDYIRFTSNRSRFLSLPGFAIDGRRPHARSSILSNGANILPSPASFPSPSYTRGRTHARGRFDPIRSLSGNNRPNHLWREPSPDVWSIEEETEEDLASEFGSIVSDEDPKKNEKLGLDGVAAKPKKRVRFVLPANE